MIILKKELKRFFTDRRMLLAMFLPGVLIFIIYRAMGSLMGNVASSTEPTEVSFKVAYTDNYGDKNNLPEMLSFYKTTFIDNEQINTNKNKIDYTPISTSRVNEYKDKLNSNEYDLVVEFSDGFETNIKNGQTGNNVNFYYNGKNGDSE